VGRALDNAVHIPIPRVSKHHAKLRVAGDRLFVRDLGSTNGTEVDGRGVGKEEVEVPLNSSIHFADALLRRPAGRTRSETWEGRELLSSKLSYNVKEGYSAEARDRIVDLSSALFELLASNSDAEGMQESACRFVGEYISADRVVLLEGQDVDTVRPRAQWTKKGKGEESLRLSSTIVAQVLRQRDAVLVADALDDPNYVNQASIVALDLRSAMAAPLFDNQRVHGLLYVDTANPTLHYTKEDLQVLNATANAVAIKLRNLSLEKEMKTAGRIQRAMLPKEINAPPGYEMEAYQLMCLQVGGDLYHCLPRPDGKLLLGLGDVAGKGMPAALAMGAAIVLIGLLAEVGGDLEAIVQHLHRQLFRSLAEEQFLTLFLAELDGETGVLTYVNAGHDPPLLVRKGGDVEQLGSTGLPVAMLPDLPVSSGQAQIGSGDLLMIFSDGIPEATPDTEHFLGLEPVEEILVRRRNDSLAEIRKEIVSTVSTFLKGEPSSDDVTLLLLRRGEN
jgi:serine phosphatase RsbU (regulator of sigma subunit)